MLSTALKAQPAKPERKQPKRKPLQLSKPLRTEQKLQHKLN